MPTDMDLCLKEINVDGQMELRDKTSFLLHSSFHLLSKK